MNIEFKIIETRSKTKYWELSLNMGARTLEVYNNGVFGVIENNNLIATTCTEVIKIGGYTWKKIDDIWYKRY